MKRGNLRFAVLPPAGRAKGGSRDEGLGRGLCGVDFVAGRCIGQGEKGVSLDTGPRLAIIVEQGKTIDFIDGTTQRPATPEEHVRQEIAKSLVREYGYPRSDIEVEFVVRVGTRKPRADLVVFADGE